MSEERDDEQLYRLALEIDRETIDSTVLRRLITEVRQQDGQEVTRAYNRTHNRHNRRM